MNKRRRKVQEEYNEAHGITPQTIQKSVRDLIAISKKVAADDNALKNGGVITTYTPAGKSDVYNEGVEYFPKTFQQIPKQFT